jgi:hypothetical protein
MIAKDIAGTDNHEDRPLWLLVRSLNRQGIDNHMVMRLLRDPGIQVLKKPTDSVAPNSCRTGLDRRPAGYGQNRPCWIDPGFRP